MPPALVPVTTSMRVPAGMPLAGVTVKVDVPDPEIEAGLKLVVTPGEPRAFAASVTLPVKPFPAVSEIVAVPGVPPGVRFKVLGEAASVKYGFAVEVGASASIIPEPFGVPQPVTLSKPVLAVNEPAKAEGTLVPLGLLPLVMSWNAVS